MTQLVWFRNDLRLRDNPALTAAVKTRERVEACFLITPQQWADHDWSPRRTDLMLRSLECLGQDLAALGIPLHTRTLEWFEDSDDALISLCLERGLERIHANEEYAVNERTRDKRLCHGLARTGITLSIYRDQSLVPVTELKTGKNTPYTVFTPYSRQWWHWVERHQPVPHPLPGRVAAGVPEPSVPSLPEWRSSDVKWLAPGEAGAARALERFLEQRVTDYRDDRDYPARDATSILSPYLALGILSPRQCLAATRDNPAINSASGSAGTWLNEIAWRDFYIQLLYHFPRLSRHRAFKPETERLEWNRDPQALAAWQEGRTGIPIVDAAMRQLNQTGWMHNRLRMVTAMFLSKNLFIDWREGERYFMRQLVDGYLPSNNGGWQWSASTGTDAAPYFRVFNPVTQSERFDPEGAFIRRYVPEIAHLEGKALFNPNGGVREYPEPIVDLKESRKEAIARFQALSE